MGRFDIAFVGHMCYDEIVPFRGETTVAPGSAVLCGAMAAARVGKKVAVITKMAREDEHILKSMKSVGIKTYLIPSHETTYMKVVHPSDDVDEREMIQLKNAGYFSMSELPEVQSKFVHLAGITNQEFSLEFIQDLKKAGYNLSVDLQSFVRQVDPETRQIAFREVPHIKEMIPYFSRIKLDVVESEILTGTSEIDEATQIIKAWGVLEVIITQSEGVLACTSQSTFYEKFTNRSVIGRTGRGDTTFAGYLAWRMNNNVKESLRFASALVSIKMETPGPFSGSLEDVLRRMNQAVSE